MTSTTHASHAAPRHPGLLRRLLARLRRDPAATQPATATPPCPRHAPAPPTAIALARCHIATAVRSGRLADATRLAAVHVDDTARRYGTDHPYTAEALEILAHVCALAGDEHRALSCFLQAAHHRSRSTLLPTPDPIPGLAARALAAFTAAPDHRRHHLAAAAAR